jgi:murein DD-endopeptidase MepM/ murein hydrolase activator NlpD
MPPVDLADIDRLRARQLLLPVRGVGVASLRDTFGQLRGLRVHEAIDILAPRGTEVLATDDGPVMRLFHSVRGGTTVYQFDPSSTYCYYFAYVGTSGNAPPDTPHLHFQVIKLGPEKKWWEGTSIDPYPLWAFGPGPTP